MSRSPRTRPRAQQTEVYSLTRVTPCCTRHSAHTSTPRRDAPRVTPLKFVPSHHSSKPTYNDSDNVHGLPTESDDYDQRVVNMEDLVAHTFTKLADTLSQALSAALPTHLPTPPPRFSGSNVREWLRQARRYYEKRDFSNEEALDDVISFLEGDALNYWCTLLDELPEPPTEWIHFEQHMLARYCRFGVGATVLKLKALQFNGDIFELSDQFARILSEGFPPAHETTRDIFLGLLPYSLASKYLHDDSIHTWVDAREKICNAMTKKSERCLAWWNAASPANRKEVLQNRDVMLEGWVPVDLARGTLTSRENRPQRGRVSGGGSGSSRNNNNNNSSNNQNNGIKCFVCSGNGHRGRDCPNTKPGCAKSGKCNRCGGNGHWAPDCTSPKSAPRTGFKSDNAMSSNAKAVPKTENAVRKDNSALSVKKTKSDNPNSSA